MSTPPSPSPHVRELAALLADCLPPELLPLTLPATFWREPGGLLHREHCPFRAGAPHDDDELLTSPLLELLVADCEPARCCPLPLAPLAADPYRTLLRAAAALHHIRALLECLAEHEDDSPHARAELLTDHVLLEILSLLADLRVCAPRLTSNQRLAAAVARSSARARTVLRAALRSSPELLALALEDALEDMPPERARALTRALRAPRTPPGPDVLVVVARSSLRRHEEVVVCWVLADEILEAADCLLLRLDAHLARAFIHSSHVLPLRLEPATPDLLERARLGLEMRPELASCLLSRAELDLNLVELVHDSLDAAARALEA